MSRLRQAFLEQIRIIGNRSGCHQLPERSFFWKGKQFPVCARCTGIVIGELIAVVVLFCKRIPSILFSASLIVIMGIDWAIQKFQIRKSTNIRRLLTGICGGIGVVVIYYHIARIIVTQIRILNY